jgi:hypothetical protein
VCDLVSKDSGLRGTATARIGPNALFPTQGPHAAYPNSYRCHRFILLSWDRLSHFLSNILKKFFIVLFLCVALGGGWGAVGGGRGDKEEGGYSVHIIIFLN